jgi:hypothetical protein
MTEERNGDMDRDLDELLRNTLADDLPDDVAAGMRERLARFRAEMPTGAASLAPSAAWAWLFRRRLWAGLSILMLIAGLLLQGGKPRSPLAERIAAIKIEYASLDTTRR